MTSSTPKGTTKQEAKWAALARAKQWSVDRRRSRQRQAYTSPRCRNKAHSTNYPTPPHQLFAPMANNKNASDDGLTRTQLFSEDSKESTPASLIVSPPATGPDGVSEVIDFSKSVGTAESNPASLIRSPSDDDDDVDVDVDDDVDVDVDVDVDDDDDGDYGGDGDVDDDDDGDYGGDGDGDGDDDDDGDDKTCAYFFKDFLSLTKEAAELNSIMERVKAKYNV
jgi:hypothetical protein